MIEFYISVSCLEGDEKGQPSCCRKKVWWPALPRVGEKVQISDVVGEVWRVYHWMDRGVVRPYIEVELRVHWIEYLDIIDAPGWEKVS